MLSILLPSVIVVAAVATLVLLGVMRSRNEPLYGLCALGAAMLGGMTAIVHAAVAHF